MTQEKGEGEARERPSLASTCAGNTEAGLCPPLQHLHLEVAGGVQRQPGCG